MKSVRVRIKTLYKRGLFALSALAVAAGPFLAAAPAGAASATITINGSQQNQTMDGFGASINVHSWNNGALRPVLDSLIDQNGMQVFRVVLEMTDWEQTNDNADSTVYNWDYYNNIYSSTNFTDLWNTIDYLHQRGIPDNQIILSFMGIGPSWMGGATLSSSKEDEWVEMVVSAAYYGYTHGHTFGIFSPDNEEDIGHNEGIGMSTSLYGDAMSRVATRLDNLGMGSVRLVGPETATVSSSYTSALASHANTLSKVDHLDYHNYSGSVGSAKSIASSYGKNFWMSEYSVFDQSFSLLSGGASGLMMWDAYDSVYKHAILNGLGSQPGNDAGNAPAMIAYNASTQVYTPRIQFYQFGQLFKYVPIGSVRIGASSSNSAIHLAAFRHAASGRFTLVGNNTSTSSQTLTISLTNIPNLPSKLAYYQTNSTSNMAQGADVTVNGTTATVTVPASTVFTLTNGTPDTQAPAATITAPADGTTVSGSQTVSVDASDNTGVSKVEWYLDDVLQATDTSAPYSFSWNTAQTANGAHTLTAKAYDAANNVGTSPAVSVTVQNDTTAPSVPANLSATATGTTSAQLAWDASSDDTAVTGYHVSRGGTQIATVTVPGYADAGLTPGTTYSYTVSAFDAAGNESAQSDAANTTTDTPPPDTQAPTAPASLHQTGSTRTSVTFGWDASSDNVGVTAYEYYLNGDPAGTTASTSATLSSLTCGTDYTVAVDAVDAAGNRSEQTNGTVTTSDCDTTAPTVSVTTPAGGATVSGTSVNVTANASDDTDVVGVQFKLDGVNLGTEDTSAPYSVTWDTTTATAGSHTLTAVARDAAGNSTVSASVQITVNNTVAPAPVAVDAQVTTHQSSKATSITSGSLSTTQANDLLVAFITSDGPSTGGSQTFSSVTGGNLTWTLRKRVNTQAGTSEIWTAVAPSTVSGLTVKATRGNGSYVGSITVVAFKNANTTAIGATAGASASTGAPTVSLTATQTGSVVWAVGNDWDSATNRTVGSGQTMVDQYLASTGDTLWVQRLADPTTAGQNVTINDTAPTKDRWNLAAIEILPAP